MYGLYEVCKTTCSDIWKYDTSYFMHFLWHYTVSYFVSWFFIGASRCARQIWWLEMLHVHVSGAGFQFSNKIFNVLNLCIPLIVLSFCVSYRLQLFIAKIRVWMRIPCGDGGTDASVTWGCYNLWPRSCSVCFIYCLYGCSESVTNIHM